MNRMPIVTSKSSMFFITVWVIAFFCCCFPVYGEDTHYQDSARLFVEECLKDPNVFIFNPPADVSPYKDMTREQVQQLGDKSMMEGSVLILYPNGLPATLNSKSKEAGREIQKSWYMNGRLRSDEIFSGELYTNKQLLSGSYYDMNGAAISQVEKGTGKRIVFDYSRDMNSLVAKTIEYSNGLMHGTEVFYRDYETRLISEENHYKYGKQHGKSTRWNSEGGLNFELNYREGLRHGKERYWYSNGNIQSISEYAHGKHTGTSTRFYENGRKASEYSAPESKKWYPSGQLMSKVTYHKPPGEWTFPTVEEAVSYDPSGHETGRVVNGVGYLIEKQDASIAYNLKIYLNRGNCKTIDLGILQGGYNHGENILECGFELRAPKNAAMENVCAEILLPDGCTSEDTLVFTKELIESGDLVEMEQCRIKFPVLYDEWEGKVVVDVEARIEGCLVHFQYPMISKIASKQVEKQKKSKTKEIRRTPPSRKRSILHLGTGGSNDWRGTPPTFKNKPLPPKKKAVGFCISENKRWVLFKEPAVLLVSEDSGKSWQVLRSDFTYRPKGFLSLFEEDMLIWGIHRTETPEKGIPYSVESSTDEGLTWSEFKIPRLDYLLSIGYTSSDNDVLMVEGICLPSDGIPPKKDWFEFKPKHFFSINNQPFMESAGGGFEDSGQFLFSSDSPNGNYRAYVIHDRSYAIYIKKSHDDYPVCVLSVSSEPQLIWSENSDLLALQNEYKNVFIAYVEIETFTSAKCKFNPEKDKSAKATDEILDFDKEVQLLLQQNRR